MKSPKARSSQENRNNAPQEFSELPWREEKTATAKPRSHGLVSAKACYSNSRQLEGNQVVHKLKSDIRDRSIKMKKKRIGSECEAKLQAFKQVTTYKTWPVQERAFHHWNELRREYLQQDCRPNGENNNPSEKATSLEVWSVSAEVSSCSSSSASSNVDEPKRLHIDPLLSPAKSRLKFQYQRDFTKEQKLPKQPISGKDLFAPALWSMEPRVFSYERNSNGKRSYVVAQMGRFLDKYWRRTDPKARHYYEVIPEHTPCRLYLDLEFSKTTCNEELRDDKVAERLMTELFLELQAEFKAIFDISLEREHIVDLDSSTSAKFSRHWVVHLPNDSLFRDNISAGRFVKNFVGRLAEEQATEQLEKKDRHTLHKHLFVETSNKCGPGSTTCIIDLGVYTRNRLFRLLGSQKFGKPPSAALRLANTNQFPFPAGFDNTSFFLPAMGDVDAKSSEQQHSQDDSFTFEDALEQAVEKFVAMTDWSLHAEALALTLVVPMNAAKIDYQTLPCDNIPDDPGASQNIPVSHRPRMTAPSSLSVGETPFPSLDKFVTDSLATRGGIQGYFRAWSIDRNDRGLATHITYQMVRNRYCECVGRSHKSNNIMWTVDLRTFVCWQGCHDPDCRLRNFRGAPIELPEAVREHIREVLFEEELASLTEADLLADSKSAPGNEEEAHFRDDADFEQALASLKLDCTQEAAVVNTDNDTGDVHLSDDALLNAMLNAPELFP